MNQAVKNVFESYPETIHDLMIILRGIILDTAAQFDTGNAIEETLKWGKPSYLVKGGSTVRIAWKPSKPKFIGIYFNCNTKLIDTFRTIYGEALTFEGNRAILLDINKDLPFEMIKECIHVALTYHKRKAIPLLGM